MRLESLKKRKMGGEGQKKILEEIMAGKFTSLMKTEVHRCKKFNESQA